MRPRLIAAENIAAGSRSKRRARCFNEAAAHRRGKREELQEIADAIKDATGVEVNRETLRLWFVGRIQVETRVVPASERVA